MPTQGIGIFTVFTSPRHKAQLYATLRFVSRSLDVDRLASLGLAVSVLKLAAC
tara:strand:- start:322 stop:480 length:159 start_codon:yes stop_codon:yes gene_type:complete